MRFVRYVAVQVVAYGVDMGGFLILNQLGHLGPIISNVLAKIVAGGIAFIAHRYFTFRAWEHGRISGQAVRYFVTLACNIPFASGLMKLVMFVVTVPAAAKFIADLANIAATYWVSRTLIFGDRPSRRVG